MCFCYGPDSPQHSHQAAPSVFQWPAGVGSCAGTRVNGGVCRRRGGRLAEWQGGEAGSSHVGKPPLLNGAPQAVPTSGLAKPEAPQHPTACSGCLYTLQPPHIT